MMRRFALWKERQSTDTVVLPSQLVCMNIDRSPQTGSCSVTWGPWIQWQAFFDQVQQRSYLEEPLALASRLPNSAVVMG